MKATNRLRTFAASAALLAAFFSAEARAWKPTMHVHLAEEARLDALDGFVSIDVDALYRAGDPGPAPPRTYAVDPSIRQALADHAQQFRAGVLGPDAYPDILTGQAVIHANDENPGQHTRGSDAWLDLLWNEAQSDLAGGDDRPLAFVLGILAHAAGDMYAHTFVNHYADGPFEIGENAVTHTVVEGYVGTRSPDPVYDMSIAGLEGFVYEHMIDSTPYPRTPLTPLFEAKGSNADPSLPWFFSKLRSALQEFVDDWHAMGEGPEKWVIAPAIPYANAWIRDIDRGLREWPSVSTEVAIAIFYNPSGQSDMDRAEDALQDYFYLHIIPMLGAPDVVGDLAWLIDQILSAVPAIPDPLQALEDRVLDFMVEQATGRSKSEWKSFLTEPEKHMTRLPRLTSQGLCGPRPDDCKAEVDQAMGIDPADPSDRIDWQEFAPAFNTVTMIKLAMLSDAGRRALMTDLGYPASLTLQYEPLSGPLANAMIGFMKSLDESRQWNVHERQMLTHFDCWLYQQTFLSHKGDLEFSQDYTYLAGAPPNQPRHCPDISAVEFNRVTARTQEDAFCGRNLITRVSLDVPADEHGAVVRMATTGALSAPEFGFIEPGLRSTLVTLSVAPVSSHEIMTFRAEREGNQSVSAWVRAPQVEQAPVRADELGGERTVPDGGTVLGGTPVEIEAAVDCNNAVAGAKVDLQLCPIFGFGGCLQASLDPGDPWRLELPYVRTDQTWRLRSTFNGEHVDRTLVLLSSEVKSVELSSAGGVVGIQSGQTSARVELLDPPPTAKLVHLDYALPLSGPASITFPAGQRVLDVPIVISGSLVAARCITSRGLILATSAADRQAYGPLVNGRERWDEYLAQGAGFDLSCYGPIDPRLELFAGPITGADFEPDLDPLDPFDPGDPGDPWVNPPLDRFDDKLVNPVDSGFDEKLVDPKLLEP